ncbi:hypothetical protein P7K49_006115 [Saguinus oedipus]|uniref:Uncharacterized protein n=1 Tax=Saguinus oedipus TaxID=9490 RepID=A0ABQ9W1H9_SAGOE|nr:hypothetical protein P7K49_006115 [Saguinus oedipus]
MGESRASEALQAAGVIMERNEEPDAMGLDMTTMPWGAGSTTVWLMHKFQHIVSTPDDGTLNAEIRECMDVLLKASNVAEPAAAN